METELVPIQPVEAQNKYLTERKEDASYETMRTVRQGVELFVEWCETAGIENLNVIGGRQLTDFKTWVKENTDTKTISLNGLLSVLRRFMVFCVRIEAVTPDVPNKVPIPKVPDDEEVSDEKPSDEQVYQVLQYLGEYEPASRRHVEYLMIKELGCRVGACRAVDVTDVHLGDDPKIWFRHRPEGDDVKGTPLKNDSDGQRPVSISRELADLIQRYLNNPRRHDVTDKFGREPLLTTKGGRPDTDTIKRDLYKLTRPCEYSGDCPHDRDIESCEATLSRHASKCPTSSTPHPLRRWSIEYQIDQGVPKDKLSDRVDVSVPVLNKHYDNRNEERKRQQRFKVLQKLFPGIGDEDATLSEAEKEALTNDDGMIDSVLVHQLIRLEEQQNSRETGSQDIDDVPEEQPTPEDTNETDVSPDQDEDQSSLYKFEKEDHQENEQHRDDAQLSLFDDFDEELAVVHPLLAPLIGGTAAIEWVPGRVDRELNAMTPQEEDSPWPGPARAAKGMTAYAVYVCMVALNLILLGVVPV